MKCRVRSVTATKSTVTVTSISDKVASDPPTVVKTYTTYDNVKHHQRKTITEQGEALLRFTENGRKDKEKTSKAQKEAAERTGRTRRHYQKKLLPNIVEFTPNSVEYIPNSVEYIPNAVE